MAADRSFQQALPMLVVGLDDIDPPPLLLGGRHDLAHDEGLV